MNSPCPQLAPEPTCVNFTLERWFPVANMSRYLPVRVYDYYAPGQYATATILYCNLTSLYSSEVQT